MHRLTICIDGFPNLHADQVKGRNNPIRLMRAGEHPKDTFFRHGAHEQRDSAAAVQIARYEPCCSSFKSASCCVSSFPSGRT